MTYRCIAVHANNGARAVARITLASAIARTHDAHLIGVSATGLALSPVADGSEGGFMMTAVASRQRERCAESGRRFDTLVRGAGVDSYEHRVADDEDGYAMVLTARYADLVVIGQNDVDDATIGTAPNFAEQVLLYSGRPVLIVPHAGSHEGVGDVVLVAWDGSRESARALTDALPILERARRVHVVIVDAAPTLDGHGAEPGADVGLFLARHGVQVDVHREATNGTAVADVLLSRAADLDVDMIVLGGFGHSRFREMILGGVTRHVLEHMTVPVLMSH